MSAAARKALRVHIGPVQGYIAPGRRTRDFWAGSFLLSRLAGEAMAEIIEMKGKISVPDVGTGDEISEPTLKAICEARRRTDAATGAIVGPSVGTLVNHFRAEFPGDAATTVDTARIANAVRGRFQAIGDVIWRDILSAPIKRALADDKKYAEIEKRWRFQTSGDFFEVLFVCGDATDHWRDESRWLDRRKFWRSQKRQLETEAGLPGIGDRCPVHPEFCELGGYSRITERDGQNAFWQALRQGVGQYVYGAALQGSQFYNTLEIRESERLSGMALVKRLFPLLSCDALTRTIGWVPGQGVTDGSLDPREAQRALRNWPSTSYVAAVPWIIHAYSKDPDVCNAYAHEQIATLAQKKTVDSDFDRLLRSEQVQHHRIAGINAMRDGDVVPSFAVIDGTLHFERGLDRHRVASENLCSLVDNFGAFRKAINLKGESASPFYAHLEMDGDGMGEWFSKNEDVAQLTSKALLRFASGVGSIVSASDGVLIYAGADDVNAMLPIETAIQCAVYLRAHWKACFADWQKSIEELAAEPKGFSPPTLSGSIVFADYQVPLDDVRRRTHHRLDVVAKDGVGRDALAMAVFKSGGETADWASTWYAQEKECSGAVSLPEKIFALARRGGRDVSATASRLPYIIRDRLYPVLNSHVFSREELIDFLVAEIGDTRNTFYDHTRKVEDATLVADIIFPRHRRNEEGEIHFVDGKATVGGLLIARFLAGACLWPYVEGREKLRAQV